MSTSIFKKKNFTFTEMYLKQLIQNYYLKKKKTFLPKKQEIKKDESRCNFYCDISHIVMHIFNITNI